MKLGKLLPCGLQHLMESEDAKEEKSIAELSRDPIPASDFLRELKKKKKKGILLWEFKALNRHEIEHTHEVALLPANVTKNTSADVLPYDHCRVLLHRLPNEYPSSDYINASYVDSYTKPKAYIATQGPNRRTVADFWKTVWQENVHCIVMATNLFEHARQQCEKYWHNQHGRYGDIHVWLETSDILADFTIRTFRLQKSPDSEERIIKQFQYSCWSDHECPNPGSVLEYRRRIRAYARNKPGPILVHCGSGAGRTGAFIAVDAALERLTLEKTIDIFNYVQYLRNCRKYMVRNIQQYEFVYDTVAMFLQCGITVINAKELPYVVQRLAIRDPQTKSNGFEREFKTLQTVVPKLSVGECAGGHRAENRRKSRDIMIQPPERARPYLITHDSNDSTDYINAVYVDGYRHGNAYIVTQWPLKSTVNDVWRLIYDYNIPTLVLLNDMPFTRSCPQFWPSVAGEEVHYGPLTVELLEEDSTEHIATKLFKIKKIETLVSLQAMASNTEDSAKTVRFFQLKCWPNNQRMPSSPSAFIELLTRVEDWQVTQCHGRIPTLVMSKNGVSRCGIYCTISITWDKLKTEGEVDIFRAVRTVKSNRTQLVENMSEYIYCYTFLVILLEILNATHPHMIPVNDSMSESTRLVNPALVPSNHTGEHPNAYKSLTTDPSHLALLVYHQNSPRAERRIIMDDASDQESFHSTVEQAVVSTENICTRRLDNGTTPHTSVHQRTPDSSTTLHTPDSNKKYKIMQKKLGLLAPWKAARNGSPGRAIKIFATETSCRMNGFSSMSLSDQSHGTGSPFIPNGRKQSIQSDRSVASSYATCLDVFEDHLPSPVTPTPQRLPLPVIVIDQVHGDEPTSPTPPNKSSSCSDLERLKVIECARPPGAPVPSNDASYKSRSTISLGVNGQLGSVHTTQVVSSVTVDSTRL